MSFNLNTAVDAAIATDQIDGTSDAQDRRCDPARWAVSPYYRDAWRTAALALLTGLERSQFEGTVDAF